MKKTFIFIVFTLSVFSAEAQFHPGVGIPGTSAMHKDSSAFVAWASAAIVVQGPREIGVDTSGIANAGTNLNALGKAGENPTVSLGDGGYAIMQFPYPIRNGEGYDFAVFENSFDGTFLELAFVEVSSDGINFYRFNASSLTDTSAELGVFGLLDPKNLDNLAGKYPLFYGTPFDLEELSGISGLDVNAVTHVKVLDVIGTINPEFCSRDGAGRIVVDPFPTPFAGGGFDLDAVGVMHHQGPSSLEKPLTPSVMVFPQPASNFVHIRAINKHAIVSEVSLYSMDGRELLKQNYHSAEFEFTIELERFSSGMYVLVARINDELVRKVIQVTK